MNIIKGLFWYTVAKTLRMAGNIYFRINKKGKLSVYLLLSAKESYDKAISSLKRS